MWSGVGLRSSCVPALCSGLARRSESQDIDSVDEYLNNDEEEGEEFNFVKPSGTSVPKRGRRPVGSINGSPRRSQKLQYPIQELEELNFLGDDSENSVDSSSEYIEDLHEEYNFGKIRPYPKHPKPTDKPGRGRVAKSLSEDDYDSNLIESVDENDLENSGDESILDSSFGKKTYVPKCQQQGGCSGPDTSMPGGTRNSNTRGKRPTIRRSGKFYANEEEMDSSSFIQRTQCTGSKCPGSGGPRPTTSGSGIKPRVAPRPTQRGATRPRGRVN
jgi:hypothetical protein